MAHFTTAGKRYREGTDFSAFPASDVGVTSGGATFDHTAPAALPDGAYNRQFLFWDTGRRLTGKRRVRWTFNHPENWTTWNAVAWYGVPSTGPNGGEPVVSLDAYWVSNGTMDPTPIDGPGSSFVNGPGAGDVAWPWQGNDHQVRTQWGPATIRAKDHLQRTPADPQLDFSSLSQFTFGGDDSGFFQETDDDITSSGGITGIANTTAQQLTFAQGSGGLVLAGYVQPVLPRIDLSDALRDIIREAIFHRFKDRGDPSPEDIIRLKLIEESINVVRGERPTGDAFEGLVAAARTMSAAELKRTITATRATVSRGEAALKSLESLAANPQHPIG